MIVSLTPILDVLGKADAQYLIPIFQRVYSWNRMQCDQLWEDIVTAAQKNKMHFIGTLILRPEEENNSEGACTRRVSLIDGQQRLTTVTLLLIALRDHLARCGDPAYAHELEERYLQTACGAPKLILSESDAPTLAHLVFGASSENEGEHSQFLMDNCRIFREKLEEGSVSVNAVMAGLKALRVVLVQLEGADEPQQVFESLNAKGRPLSTTDLLRNVLVVKYGQEEQERLFDVYWTPLDQAFRQFGSEQDIYLDAALHAWITQHAPEINAAKRTDLYQAYKLYIAQSEGLALEDLLKSINKACLDFAAHPDTAEAKKHLDWVVDKPTGLISERKLFGD